MEIKARQKNNVIILDLHGRIDIDSANLIEVVGQCIRDGYNDILCNFEDVEFIDYMGISVIVIAYKEIINNRGRMKFVNIPAHLRGIFSVAGIDRAIEIYATEDLAVNSFKEDKIIEDIQKMQLRRRFKRLPIEIKIDVKDKYEKAVCLKVEILNLSAVGAYIYGCERFKLGDEVVLKMKLAPNQEELELEAKVVWLPDKQIQHQIYPGMGVEFYNIAKPAQQRLLEFIERNLSFMSTD
ncbi:MAG: anti-sigma factor antagonist [Candidatus Omnitrophica bacterium]|nr:anti-sigma factor antagonist [Candidatus Omnitrophota bacterium]MDD5238086.1 anti-sigma factor antagonist [Candidatus Omnitrophota bacterium]